MALRNKNYRENRIEVSSHREEPPVSTPPAVTAAELPPIAADIKPPEPIEEKSPAEKAGESALRQRLKEMENAEAITRQPPQRPPPQQEPPPQLQEPQQPTLEQAIAGFAPRFQEMCRADPRLLTDPERISQVQYCHHVAVREVGEEGTPAYFDRMEQMLGFTREPSRSPSNGHAGPRRSEPPPPRRTSTSVSVPPTREAPSMATGRATTSMPPLTREEREIAWVSRPRENMTQEQAERLYQHNKREYQRAKTAGEIQDGR